MKKSSSGSKGRSPSRSSLACAPERIGRDDVFDQQDRPLLELFARVEALKDEAGLLDGYDAGLLGNQRMSSVSCSRRADPIFIARTSSIEAPMTRIPGSSRITGVGLTAQLAQVRTALVVEPIARQPKLRSHLVRGPDNLVIGFEHRIYVAGCRPSLVRQHHDRAPKTNTSARRPRSYTLRPTRRRASRICSRASIGSDTVQRLRGDPDRSSAERRRAFGDGAGPDAGKIEQEP